MMQKVLLGVVVIGVVWWLMQDRQFDAHAREVEANADLESMTEYPGFLIALEIV